LWAIYNLELNHKLSRTVRRDRSVSIGRDQGRVVELDYLGLLSRVCQNILPPLSGGESVEFGEINAMMQPHLSENSAHKDSERQRPQRTEIDEILAAFGIWAMIGPPGSAVLFVTVNHGHFWHCCRNGWQISQPEVDAAIRHTIL
jgi:hypothetical protein